MVYIGSHDLILLQKTSFNPIVFAKLCFENNHADQIHVHVCNVLCVFSGIPLILSSFVVFDVPAAADDKENLAICLCINSRGLHRCLYFI